MSAGVPVEVCRVIADDPKKSLKALEKLKKKQAVAASSERIAASKAKKEDISSWSDVEADDTEAEEDEWKYESEEEGKAEGRWEDAHDSKRRKITK